MYKIHEFRNFRKVATVISRAVVSAFLCLGFYVSTAAENFPSQIKIEVGKKAITRLVQIGTNKSMVIEINKKIQDVLVANPEIADAIVRTPTRIYVLAGSKVGQTNIFLFGRRGRQLATIDLSVSIDTKDLDASLKKLLPGSNIFTSSVGSSVVLSGAVASPEDALRANDIAAQFVGNKGTVVNMLGTAGKDQVHLKVTIAEVQRSAVKQLGVNLSSSFSSAGDLAYNIITNNPFGVQGTSINNSVININRGGPNPLAAQLRMLRRNGILQTLAEPTLTAASGESAEFLVGGEFPVPFSSSDGDIAIEFKKFGVELNFTPIVLSPGRISLKISTAVSALSNASGVAIGGVTVPGLQSRRAETTVELPSGGSLVMAGLLQDEIRKSLNGTDWLMNVPILGNLFRSKDFERSQTELAIFVTPFIVEANSISSLTQPSEDVKFTNYSPDSIWAEISNRYSGNGGTVHGHYEGQYGFIYR